MENPYAGEWSKIAGAANEVRDARDRISGLEEQARQMQAAAQSLPVMKDENGNDTNAQMREGLNAQAQEAQMQLQMAREDLEDAVSSAHRLARGYGQEKSRYEKKAGKTAKAGGTFGKLTGYRFGASTAAEGKRVADQTEKSYRDRVKALSALIEAAEAAADGIAPNGQGTSGIADKGVFHKPAGKRTGGRSYSKAAGSAPVKGGGSRGRGAGAGSTARRRDNGKERKISAREREMQTLAASLLETGTRDSLVQDWSGRSRADPEGKYQYNMLNPGPLSEKEASSFYNCMYNCEVLQEDRIYYRIGTGDGRGRWFTAAPPESIIQGRLNSAIPLLWMDPEGNFDGASEIDTLYSFVVPKGTVVFTGPVRDQAGMSAGGLEHEQVYIRDISAIALKDSHPIDTIPGEKTILNEASDNPVRLVPRKGHLVPDYLKVRDTEKITLEDHPDPTALKTEHLYIYNENEYLTDKNGNLAYAHMIIKKTEGPKELKESHKEYRNTGGKNAEHPDMDAGHILAVSSGQHPSFTMEQHYATNRWGAFRDFELYLDDLAGKHDKVEVYAVFTEDEKSKGTYSPFWMYSVYADGKPIGDYSFTNDSTQSKV